jgi:N-acetylglucosaminyl-diphospho-decaprenol L-rhamnosyltransferase
LTPEAVNPEQQAKRVSIVIVSFDRVESLRRSLAALGDAHQILVVDNGSRDDSPNLGEEFPSVRFIRLPKNFGLTKALNIGLRAADSEYVLFLHDDARIAEEAVSELADYLEARQDAGAVCPLLVSESGTRAPQVRALPTPSAPDPPLQQAQGETEIAAACVSGAAIMFRLFFLRALRQIDEHYGNYGSEIELSWQVQRAARKLLILPHVTAVHESLPSPMYKTSLAGDRAVGTAVYIGKHHGFMAGILYRIKVALTALFSFRFKVIAGVLSGVKIDGS